MHYPPVLGDVFEWAKGMAATRLERFMIMDGETMVFFVRLYENLGAKTRYEEVENLRAMCARMPKDRSELLSDERVLAGVGLGDDGRLAVSIRGVYGDDAADRLAIARGAALRGYHRAWGF